MPLSKLPAGLADRLREAGLKVVEIDGWENRASAGGASFVGVLNHHTGARDDLGDPEQDLAYAKWMFLTGRDDLDPPLCNIALSVEAVVYLGASGNANHGGTARASGSVAAGDANRLYVGIEWMLSGTQPIPKGMYEAGAILNAVLLDVLGSSVQAVSCHYQTSITGKWDIGDPNGIYYEGHRVLDVPKFRLAVTAAREEIRNTSVVQAKARYDWFQPGHIGTHDSGCALGVSRQFGTLRDRVAVVGSPATSEGKEVTGHGIGPRTILRGQVHTLLAHGHLSFGAAGGHAPPRRAPKARAKFMRAFRKSKAQFRGADMNMSERMAERLLGRKVVGDGVLWLALPRKGWTVLSTKAHDVGGDHPAVLVRARHRKTGRVCRFIVINCMSVSTGPKHAARIFAAGFDLDPHVVMASECSDFRAVQVDFETEHPIQAL